MDKKRRFANMDEKQIGQMLEKVADYMEFAGEEAHESGELSEDDLDTVSAANAIPSFQSFLDKMKEKK